MSRFLVLVTVQMIVLVNKIANARGRQACRKKKSQFQFYACKIWEMCAAFMWILSVSIWGPVHGGQQNGLGWGLYFGADYVQCIFNSLRCPCKDAWRWMRRRLWPLALLLPLFLIDSWGYKTEKQDAPTGDIIIFFLLFLERSLFYTYRRICSSFF